METQNIVKSFICASAVTEFALVAFTSAGKIAVATDATSPDVIGVAQRAGSAGDAVDVVVHGLTRVIAGGSLTFATSPSSLSRLAARSRAGSLPAITPLRASSPTSIRRAPPRMSSSSRSSLAL